MSDQRTRVGWLLQCMSEGYVTPEDRAILSNWFEEDEATLNSHDRAEKAAWLSVAGEVIAAVLDPIRAEVERWRDGAALNAAGELLRDSDLPRRALAMRKGRLAALSDVLDLIDKQREGQ